MKKILFCLIPILLFLPVLAHSQQVLPTPAPGPLLEPTLEETEPEEKFSREECRWAVRWVNKEIAFLMANDTIEKIIDKEKIYEVHVGTPWDELTFQRKGEILKKLSRAREITGHSPFFSFRHHESTEIIAVVSEWAIKIRVPGEGFFEYLFENEDKENTFY